MHTIKELGAMYADRFSANDFDLEPRGLYEPMKYIVAIPGKRFRPLLLLLGCDAFGGPMDQALPAAHAMELFHNFTLVHDDIMDDATLRRGVPTVYKKYGLNAGVLAGDALLAYAYKYLCHVRPDSLSPILALFNKTLIEILEGQQMDMDFERRLDVSIDEYMIMIGYKTSVLLACSLQIGAAIAGASADDQKLLYDFGMKLGLSFQIKDDWLDTFGEGEKVGKKIGGDIIQNKKTYLLITLLNAVNESDREKLTALFDEENNEKKVSAVKDLYSKYEVSKKTLATAESLYRDSLAAISAIRIPDQQKVNLYAMADMVNKRDF